MNVKHGVSILHEMTVFGRMFGRTRNLYVSVNITVTKKWLDEMGRECSAHDVTETGLTFSSKEINAS